MEILAARGNWLHRPRAAVAQSWQALLRGEAAGIEKTGGSIAGPPGERLEIPLIDKL